MQADRGPPWITGARDPTGTPLLPGIPHYGFQIGTGSHPPRPQPVIYPLINSKMLMNNLLTEYVVLLFTSTLC